MRERGKNRKSEKVTPENFLERFVFQLGQITSFYHFPIKSWFKLFLYVKIHGNMLFSSYHPYSNANISFCKKCWLGNKKTLSYKINLYFWPWTPQYPLNLYYTKSSQADQREKYCYLHETNSPIRPSAEFFRSITYFYLFLDSQIFVYKWRFKFCVIHWFWFVFVPCIYTEVIPWFS